MSDEHRIELVYDGQCPVCKFYSRNVDIADCELALVDARERSALTDELQALGHDLDEGMALRVGERIYFGSDALHELALLSSGEGLFNRGLSRLFRNPRVARSVYPLLAAGRRGLLVLLGRAKIGERDGDESAHQ